MGDPTDFLQLTVFLLCHSSILGCDGCESTSLIWLITILIFLGTFLVAMLGFWFFFQREQILAALSKPEEHRMETRIPTRVGLELSGPDEPLFYEVTFTVNVSPHGARILTKRRWSPNDSVLVKLPEEGGPSRARITYCQALREDEFATGLQFSFLVYDWMGS
jgi:PilZ domain